jgi:uncharacterized protein YdhG (YjbR/CyaY superfamily)
VKTSGSSADVERYLAKTAPEARATLEKVRAAIRDAAPTAVEGISYGAPAVRHAGRPLAGYMAAKAHCSFFVFSPAILETHSKELAAYERSKGTVKFPIGKPLPAALIRKLVRARMKEIDAGAKY